ncbi:MAG: hydantoinase/oxoprolinase family protein [Burkholderiales bacterium]|nr:hydantoinase/oxoprolinase family protein [Burkholderiales bacterium]
MADHPAGRILVGIDTGGTFTDLVAVELPRGRHHYHKVPTLTADPAQGILDGIAELLDGNGLARGDVAFLVLGTTLATNCVLEGKWARTGVITTAGFRDVLELARQRRPHYFNLDVPKPMPPAPRDCRIEVAERVGPDGTVVVPLAEDEVTAGADRLKAAGVESVAILFLHAYANAAHEERAAALVRARLPGTYVCASHEVLSEFREFERFATTAVNASLMPVMDRYLERFEAGVAGLGIRRAPRVMQSNGGAVSPGAVRRLPVNTFFSGPAGGVIGSAELGRTVGMSELVTFDMGGTSTDVCLVRGGEPAMKSERQMGGFPVRTRSLDIHTIGAGGGSIAWIDVGGLLKVGPQSAGACPGPAAYGRGGTAPTVTDANVVLGRLNPGTLLGGRMALHAERARGAIEALATRLGVDAVTAAAGVIEIINTNMMGAVRVISVEQGEDPRDFAMVAFGGAGPLHAAEVASQMGMRRIVVPPRPGLASAVGLLHADLRGDFSLTSLTRAGTGALGALNAACATLDARGARWLAGEGERSARARWHADLRYSGQNSELNLPLARGRLDTRVLGALVEAFHRRHRAQYGYDMREQPVEFVNLRLTLTVKRRAIPPERGGTARGGVGAALAGRRRVWFPGTGFVVTGVYDRDRLPAGCRIAGPAIVEQMDATTVVPPGAVLTGDAHGCLHMTLSRGAAAAASARGRRPRWAAA